MTAATTYHVPVLLDAVVTFLTETPPGPIVDGTMGGGGHFAALIDATGADRVVIGVDRDPDAHAATRERLGAAVPDRVRMVHGNFVDLRAALARAGVTEPHMVAGILLDLGVSSWQLDAAERGFAFKHPDAPLDMRMDASSDGPTARELIAEADADELAAILREFGEVKGAHKLARRLKDAVREGALNTTGELADLVAGGRRNKPGRIHPATTVFQALRIAVNRELEALDAALEAAPDVLRPGGRLAVISYHSLEDRRVKQAFRAGERGPERPGHLPPPSDWAPTWRALTRKPVTADDAEVAANPRARSAKLRVAERAPLKEAAR